VLNYSFSKILFISKNVRKYIMIKYFKLKDFFHIFNRLKSEKAPEKILLGGVANFEVKFISKISHLAGHPSSGKNTL